mmetsp:Transcript_22770/g.40637  ORF Transcript_22770/g.40637 Transcript_22770/m.40637 type:complete len:81 (+) Transcript_22770:23-265(+)
MRVVHVITLVVTIYSAAEAWTPVHHLRARAAPAAAAAAAAAVLTGGAPLSFAGDVDAGALVFSANCVSVAASNAKRWRRR